MLGHGTGPIPSRIMLVGEAWGENEENAREAFVGVSGQELNRMLQEAGILRSECFTTNVVNARPPRNEIGAWVALKKKDITAAHVPLRDKFVLPIVAEGFARLQTEIAAVQPNVIVAFGNLALWALTGNWAITKWRGSVLQLDLKGMPAGALTDRPKVIPVVHPAAVLREWGWRAICINDLRRAKRHMQSRELVKPEWKFIIRPSFAAVKEVLDSLLNRLNAGEPLWIDFDIETRAGHIACAGISWSRTEALCVPLMCVENREGYWSLDEEAWIVWMLRVVLTHERVNVRWQNGLYDAQYTYRHWHFVPRGMQDTMISQHIMFPGLRKALDFQASMYCDHYQYWKDDGKTWVKGMGEDQLWAYNCVDCVRTREVGEVEAQTVAQMGLTGPHDFHQRLFWPVLRAMTRGVRIDPAARKGMIFELQEEISKREAYFYGILGHGLNPRSSPQMTKLFYGDLAQRPIMSRPKKGSPAHVTCDDEALELLYEREPLIRPLIRNIQEYRSLGVFLSTFAMAPLDTDGRMRCSFNVCGTETFRFSSSQNAFGSGTNLQNIPKGGEDDDSQLVLPNIRKLFVPDAGCEMFDTDLSKADLRIVVWEAGEDEMKAMLAEGRDPYVETAREFYRDPTIVKTLPSGMEHPKYRTFKSFSHGSHYLGTPTGLARRLALTVHEAERTQKWYFGKYPKIPQWQERMKEEIRRTHSVSNRFGYRRHYFDRIDDALFRKAIAWIPQSTVGILIDKVWLNIFDTLPEVEVLLQVHDSLMGQFPRHRREHLLPLMADCARVVIPYDDPLIIPIGIKTSLESWGHCA